MNETEGQASGHPVDPAAPAGSVRAPAPRHSLLRFVLWPIEWLKSLYFVVLRSADRPSGPTVLGAVSFAEASFFPIPQDPLFIALCIGKPKRSFWFGTITVVTSVLGGIFGWVLGLYFFGAVVDWALSSLGLQAAWYGTPEVGGAAVQAGQETFFENGHLYNVKQAFDDNALVAMILAAATPIPYKVATIASGVFEISLLHVILGSAIGRGLRFYSYAVIFYFFGEWARKFIERYFTLLSIIGGVLFVAGFAFFKLLA